MASYDRIDWHLDSALAGGQPPEQAFTHIGFYLAWLIRRDLHEPTALPGDHVQAVKQGDMTGSDLADDIDGKLVSHVMNAEGSAFSDACYSAYVTEYGALFDGLPDYGVVDNPGNVRKAERLLDRLYGDWVADSRPAPEPEASEAHGEDDFPPPSSMVMFPPDFTQGQMDEFMAALPGDDVEIISPPSAAEMPHVSPEIEGLIPRHLTTPPLKVSSVRATDWGSSLLNRALKRLEVATQDAVVATAIGGQGEATLTVSIYGVPGIAAERLESEFQSVIFLLPGSLWERRTVAGRDVTWASGREFSVAYWARDGMVVHAAGQPDVVEAAIPRLP